MHLVPVLSFATAMASVAAQGYVHLDIERRTPSTSGSHLRLRSVTPVNAPVNENLKNLQEYIINVTLGTPSQQLGVTLDTGSSALWVPSTVNCRRGRCDFGSFNPSTSSTYKILEQGGFNISYALAGDSDAGDWASDSVSIGGSPALPGQAFGLSNSGYDIHGVLGIGYDKQQIPTTQSSGNYPTVMDSMVTSGAIDRKAYSLYLNSYNQTRGSILFGGIDTTKYTGSLVALRLQPSPSQDLVTQFYVTLSKVSFTDGAGSNTVLTPEGYAQSVLLDSGTSYTALTNDILERLVTGMGAAAVDSSGDLSIPCQFNKTNATINYTFGGANGVTVTVPVAQTIAPGNGNLCSFGFGPTLGGISVLGDTFLRNAYGVFDIDNQIVALAQAKPGQADVSNIVAMPSGTSLPGVSSTATATGTQLSGVAATASPSLPTASYAHSSIAAAAPTFNLGAGIRSGSAGSANSAATMPRIIGLAQIAMMGAGLAVGAFI